MNEEAAHTPKRSRQTPRLRGRTKDRGKLAERLGRELQKARVREGLDLSRAAELAEVTAKRLGEIEEGAVTATISTIERIAEKVKLDWSTVFVAPAGADDVDSPKSESEVASGT